MRTAFIFISLLLLNLAGEAQDTIFKNDGSMLAAKILEINPGEIKYKKASDPDGPVYVESKTAVQSIRYANGLVEEYTPKQASAPGAADIVKADTIYKKDGSRIAVKITELNASEIRYKKYTMLDGPTYIESRSAVSAIRYSTGLLENISDPEPVHIANNQPPAESGSDYYTPGPSSTYEHYQIQQRGTYYLYNGRRLKERQMQEVLMNTKDKELIGLVQSSKDAHALKFIGFGAIPLGIAGMLVLVSSVNPYSGAINQGKVTTSGLLFVAAVACPVISIVYGHKRNAYNRMAVKLYNQKY